MSDKGRFSLFSELRKRKVFRTTAAYAVAAWLILQVGDVVLDRLPVPENTMTVLIALAALGFPIAIVLAWRFEFTPDGIFRHGQMSKPVPLASFLPYALVVAVAVGVGALSLWQAGPPGRDNEVPAIAVLPFANLSSAAGSDYFADGLTEEIQSVLVQLNTFRVTATSSTAQYRGADLEPQQIARRLGTNMLIRGSVRRDDHRVRVTATLIEGDSGIQRWSQSYDRELADVFAIQIDIARSVARALSVVVPTANADPLESWGTTDMEAYDTYLRGLDFLRRPASNENLEEARTLLARAIELDPEFGRGYAALCEAHLGAYEYLGGTGRFEQAERACHRAMTRDPDSAEVRMALGRLYLNSGQYEDAIAEFDRAIDLHPNVTYAHVGRGSALDLAGREAEAEASFRKAIQIDPSYWTGFNSLGNFLFEQGRFSEAAAYYRDYADRAVDSAKGWNNLGSAYYMNSEYDRAAEAWERSLEIQPNRTAYLNTGTMYYFLGRMALAAERYTEALVLAPEDYRTWSSLADAYFEMDGFANESEAAYRRAQELCEERLSVNPSDTEAMVMAAHSLARLGEKDSPLKLLRTAEAIAPDDLSVNYYSAVIHAQLGDAEQALQAVEHAVDLNYERAMLARDPGLAILWDDPRFRALTGAPTLP